MEINGINNTLKTLTMSLTELNKQSMLISNNDLAKHFNITTRCERMWRKQKKIPHIKIGRKVYYRTIDIIKFEESHLIKL